MKLPVAILAGGLATRLKPLTDTVPKSLLEIGGKPFAIYQLELLASKGVRRIVFCVGHLGPQFAACLGDGHRWNVSIDYVFDGAAQLGTGGALKNAVPYLGDAFLVLYGDAYLDCDYEQVEQAFFNSGQLGLMTVFRNADRWGRSNVVYSGGRIHRYDKVRQNARMHHIDYGLGALRSAALESYPPNQCLDLAVVYQNLIAVNQMAGLEVSTRFYEIGSPEGLQETRDYLLGKMRP
jgi:N-acetyl-alpha-D-muramate 1-phosphate uridylyltransferase